MSTMQKFQIYKLLGEDALTIFHVLALHAVADRVKDKEFRG